MAPAPPPPAYTTAEVRAHFLAHVRALVRHWARQPAPAAAQLDGLARDLLCALDGGAIGLPAFLVAPDPHFEDRAHRAGLGQRYYPENHALRPRVQADISGELALRYAAGAPAPGA